MSEQYRANRGQNNQFRQEPRPIAPKEIPEEYVEAAEKAILAFRGTITTTKLRNLYALMNEPYHEALRTDGDKLSESQLMHLRSARVRILYECARERDVDAFVKGTQMLPYLLSIGTSKEKLIRYHHYLEALVAYARYHQKARDTGNR